MKTGTGKKKCANGGQINNVMGGLNLATSAMSAVPGGQALAAPMGLFTSFMANQVAKSNAAAQVVSATPGNYNYGGPVTPVPQDSLRPMPYPVESTFVNPMLHSMTRPLATPLTKEEMWRDARPKVYGKDVYKATPNTPSGGSSHAKSDNRFREYANGGDVQLSDSSFQVQGNANMTDGNTYNMGNQKVKLDHDEVVTQTDTAGAYVYSRKITDPLTKNSFADVAEKIEKSTGKAEKLLKMNPYDPMAKATVNYNKQLLNDTAERQEAVATKMGLRNAPQHRAFGGDIIERHQRPPGTADYKVVERAWGGPTGGPRVNDPYLDMLVTGNTSRYDKAFGMKPLQPLDMMQRQSIVDNPTYFTEPDGTERDITELTGSNLSQVSVPTNFVSSDRNRTDPAIPAFRPAAPTATSSASADDRYKTPWTTGDAFKVVELLGKGIGAFGKAEKDQPLLDNTKITQQTYDPSAALNQTQRSFQNYANTLSAPSLNLRRSMLSAALGNQVGQKNQVLSQYDQMNQNAKTQYEQRTSAQRQFNVQSQFRTNDINAANRGAQDAVQQNFFSSVGQFGEDMNRKKYASDAMNMLRVQYPDVYKEIFKAIK